MQTYPVASGLYDPRFEHDSCGVSFVANMHGVGVQRARAHRLVGAVQPRAPRRHRRRGRHRRRRRHPDPGPRPVPPRRRRLRAPAGRELRRRHRVPAGRRGMREQGPGPVETIVADEGLHRARLARRAGRARLPRRDRPGGDAGVPPAVRRRSRAAPPGIELDRKAFVARKRIEHELPTPSSRTYFPSLSARTLVYKGMLTTPQLGAFFPDLADERVESALLLVHSRFSTNTFPSWPLAHPYRFIAHNGEINTVQGNRELDARPRGDARRAPLLPGPRAGVPDLHAGRVRHRPLRRGARAAAPRRPPAPPRRADDDPRGVGEPRRRWTPAQRGVLPVPRLADGAVGRPGQRRVHRRHGDRRRARPQRPAPEPLLGHRRRPRGDGVRGRRDRHRPGQGRHQGPAPAGPHVPHRHRAGPHRRRRRDQGDARRRAPVRRVARARASSSSTTCPTASTSCSATTACCAASRCSATPTRS